MWRVGGIGAIVVVGEEDEQGEADRLEEEHYDPEFRSLRSHGVGPELRPPFRCLSPCERSPVSCLSPCELSPVSCLSLCELPPMSCLSPRELLSVSCLSTCALGPLCDCDQVAGMYTYAHAGSSRLATIRDRSLSYFRVNDKRIKCQ